MGAPVGRDGRDSSTFDSVAVPDGFFGWLCRRAPAIGSLRTYSWGDFARDLTAGLTVATVAVPQAMAYATLAGLPPQYGLYTAIVMTAVGALLDSSRQLINGPTNAISIALLSALAVMPEADRVPAAIVLAFLIGVTQIAIALVRLGDLTRYVSHSVIVGFTLGASILLVLDQSKNLLGLRAMGDGHDHFLKRFWLTHLNGVVHWPTLYVGLGTIAIVVGLRRLNRVLKRRGNRFPIPQHLVGVIAMAVVTWQFDLAAHGVAIVGHVPSSLPSFEVPPLKWEWVQTLAGSGFAIALLGLLEAIAMSKAIATKTGQRLDVNQQCLSEGAANLAGSFFQCFPGSGSLTRSAVNQQAGAVSQWSGVFAAVAVAATVVLFAPMARYIPRASLAGLLILAAYRMIDIRQLRFHIRATRFDAGVVLATAFAALAISIEFCILIGVFLSFALYVPRAANVRMKAVTVPAWLGAAGRSARAYELDGELFFGAEGELGRHFSTILAAQRGSESPVVLVLDRTRNPDAAFLVLLRNLHTTLRQGGIDLYLAGVPDDVISALARVGLDEAIGKDRIRPVAHYDPAFDVVL